jgi:hypothetical protein
MADIVDLRLTKTVKTFNLDCACCDQPAPSHKQWFNQDDGYGLCLSCAIYIEKKEGRNEVRQSFGVPGINHSLTTLFCVCGKSFDFPFYNMETSKYVCPFCNSTDFSALQKESENG